MDCRTEIAAAAQQRAEAYGIAITPGDCIRRFLSFSAVSETVLASEVMLKMVYLHS